MTTKPKLTREQHKKIGAFLNSDRKCEVGMLVLNVKGTHSDLTKKWMKLSDLMSEIRSEMEDVCFAEGYEDATSLYYGKGEKV